MTARNNLANGNGTLSCLSSPSFPTDMRWSARERGAEAGGQGGSVAGGGQVDLRWPAPC